jgi:hypothetical protein
MIRKWLASVLADCKGAVCRVAQGVHCLSSMLPPGSGRGGEDLSDLNSGG